MSDSYVYEDLTISFFSQDNHISVIKNNGIKKAFYLIDSIEALNLVIETDCFFKNSDMVYRLNKTSFETLFELYIYIYGVEINPGINPFAY